MVDDNNAPNLDNQILNRMLQDFMDEAREHLDQLNLNLIQLESAPEGEETINVIFQTVHALKGSAGFAGLKSISEIAREMETVFGAVRRGSFKVNATVIRVMYEALDVLTALIDRTGAPDAPEVDICVIIEKLAQISRAETAMPEAAPDALAGDLSDYQELLNIYKGSYDQLAALKHIVYSATHLSDPESLAAMFSKEIHERMEPERNAVWLVGDGGTVAEVARDGKIVAPENRRVLEIESSEMLKAVIQEQWTVWSSTRFKNEKVVWPEYEAPVIFPIKAQRQAFGFLVLDPEGSAEVELYQFVGQFAAMMLNISKLHQKVETQKMELDEMTGILLKQNAHLSCLYHIELDMMNAMEPDDLLRILAKAAVNDLEAVQAAVFLVDKPAQEITGVSASGGLKGVDSVRLSISKLDPIRECLVSGRVITYKDYAGILHLGPNPLENWIVVPLKGREETRGLLVAVIADEDIIDPISILANNAGILFENLKLMESCRT